MIKLFNNIRRKNLKEGKMANYIKYAVGEIVLVVIGILIALQVNTWNQNRLNSIEEWNIIANLHKDFQENKSIIKGFIETNKNRMNAQMKLMSLIGASKEELDKHNLDSLFYVSFESNELAFADNTLKNLMQGGKLDLLKNEEINQLLYKWNALSEIRKNRIDKLDNWTNDKLVPYLLSRISFKQMDSNDNLPWSGKSKVKPDYYPLFQEVEFENYLDNSLWYYQQIMLRCNETDSLIDEILGATALDN
jgi:hypothetical protein